MDIEDRALENIANRLELFAKMARELRGQEKFDIENARRFRDHLAKGQVSNGRLIRLLIQHHRSSKTRASQ
jgi:hypothetical protein